MILSIGALTVCGIAIVAAIAYWGFGKIVPGWSALPIAVMAYLAITWLAGRRN